MNKSRTAVYAVFFSQFSRGHGAHDRVVKNERENQILSRPIGRARSISSYAWKLRNRGKLFCSTALRAALSKNQ